MKPVRRLGFEPTPVAVAIQNTVQFHTEALVKVNKVFFPFLIISKLYMFPYAPTKFPVISPKSPEFVDFRFYFDIISSEFHMVSIDFI